MMKTRAFFIFAWVVAAMSLLLSGCFDETSNALIEKQVKQIPYTVKASTAADTITKVTINFRKEQQFQINDKLVISGEDARGRLSGELSLESGSETDEAVFCGTLEWEGEGLPDENLQLTARLISENNRLVDGDYSTAIVDYIDEAVECYSSLTATSTFKDRTFELVQGTSFVEYVIRFDPAPEDGSYTARVTNNQGADVVAEGTVKIKRGKAAFTVAYPGGIELKKAAVHLAGWTAKFGGTSSMLEPGAAYEVTKSLDDLSTPLTLEATYSTTVVVSNPKGLRIEYSLNGGPNIASSGSRIEIDLSNGDIVQFYGDNAAYGDISFSNSFHIVAYGCYLYGNVMSLLSSSGYANAKHLDSPYTFAYLFQESGIKSHPKRNIILPAMELAEYCYAYMFRLSDLSTPPELPATTLSEYCYMSMFSFSSLTTAPVLPATVMKTGCYSGMFAMCYSLQVPPELPATTLAEACYYNMFSNSGLQSAPRLDAMVMAPRCYESMFASCSRLKETPQLPALSLQSSCYQQMFAYSGIESVQDILPATTLAMSCYAGMFEECKNLSSSPVLPAQEMDTYCYNAMFAFSGITTPPVLPAENLANGCYDNMFYGCINLTTAPALPATTLDAHCYDGMFRDCTSLTTAPDLLAEDIPYMAYYEMFSGCSNLSYVKCLATNWGNSYYLENWLNGVSPTGSFVKSAGKPIGGDSGWQIGPSGIPDGWTVQDAE